MNVAVQPGPKWQPWNVKLTMFGKDSYTLPMEEALRRSAAGGMVLASNKLVGDAFFRYDCEKSRQIIPDVYICWCGTMVGYTEPGKRLGKTIEFGDYDSGLRYIFPVPEEHLGRKNVALVAECRDYTLESDGNFRIVRAARVDVVENFPALNGPYMGDPVHDLPSGNKIHSLDAGARHLYRLDKRVGLVGRGCHIGNTKSVSLAQSPFYSIGVAVEAV